MKKLLILCVFLLCIYGGYVWVLKNVPSNLPAPTPAVVEKTEIPKPIEAPEPPFTIGWVGDMVPAESSAYNASVFSLVQNELQKPDLMLGNLEGTFAQASRYSKCNYLKISCHAFRGDISFADSLATAGFDFVSLVNNHVFDFGDAGLLDTQNVLDQKNIPYITSKNPTAELVIKNKKIGILGVSSTQPGVTIADYDFIQKNISDLKKRNDIVILIFHGGAEGTDKTVVPRKTEYVGSENRGNVYLVAHTAIDAGADIVLGSGPHVLRETEFYKNKPIVYSAGNFVGGNEKLTTTGALGISSIFNISYTDGIFSMSSTPITLSKQGVPSISIEKVQ